MITARSRVLVLVAVALTALSLMAPPLQAAPLEPAEDRQWALDALKVRSVWGRATGRGVVVAVLDAGVDPAARDLRGALLPGTDLVHPGAYMTDGGLGSYYAGLIAARRNRFGIVGVAPEARILPVKVTELSSTFNAVGATNVGARAEDLARGIWFALDRGARVIALTGLGSMPFSSFDQLPGQDGMMLLDRAVSEAAKRNAVLVIPAGDSAEHACPAFLQPGRTAVCVGAVDRSGEHAAYSAVDAAVANWLVVAPGGAGTGWYTDDVGAWVLEDQIEEAPRSYADVIGTVPPEAGPDYDDDGLITWSGTGVAAAHVAGVVALQLSRGMSPREAITRLRTTATDLGPTGRDQVYGYGLVNAAAAVR